MEVLIWTLVLLFFLYFAGLIISKGMGEDMLNREAIAVILRNKAAVNYNKCYLAWVDGKNSYHVMQFNGRSDFLWEQYYQNMEDAIDKFVELTDFGGR